MSLPDKPFQWVANFTMVPNEFFEIGPYLTEPELRIMLYAIRHTIGWIEKRDSREAYISVRNFAYGYTLDGIEYEGTRLTEVTIRKALPELVRLGLLERVGGITEIGQKWKLPQGCNTSALAQRDKDRYEKDRLRTANGRKKAEEKRLSEGGGLSHNPRYQTEEEGGYPITRGGVMPYPQVVHKEEHIKEKKETTSDATHQAVSPSPFKDVADEASDPAMFPVKGEKQLSAQAENGRKRLSKPTATTPPSPTPSPADVDTVQTHAAAMDTGGRVPAKRKPNRMATIIDTAWRKSVSGFLLPQLMGKADKPDRKPYNLTPACTEAEIWSFCNWWRSSHPAHIQVPTKASSIYDALIEYRGLADYETRMADAEYDVGKMFPREETPKVEAAPAPMATPEQLAEVSANFARLMETFTRQDVS